MDQIMKTSSNLSVIVPQVWSQNFYDKLLAELPFNDIVSKDYEGEIQNLGDRVLISTVPEFDDAIELEEGQKNDASAVTVTQQSLIINKRLAKDFIITNKATLQSLPVMDKLRDLAAYSIMKKFQALIISLVVPNASSPDLSIAYTSSTTLALVDILAAKELLDNQNVPMADRHCVLGAAQLNDIFAISGFTSSDFVAGSTPLINGQLPQNLVGFKPHFTSVVGNTSYWFHKSFFTVASQKGMNVKEYDLGVEGTRAARVNTDVLAGFKQLDGLRVVTIS